MNKNELISAVAEATGLSKKDATAAVTTAKRCLIAFFMSLVLSDHKNAIAAENLHKNFKPQKWVRKLLRSGCRFSTGVAFLGSRRQ